MMSSPFGEAHVFCECIECKKTRKRPVFPEIKRIGIWENDPNALYYVICPKCNTRTHGHPTANEASNAWNKHLTTKPIKKKKKKE